ncbi:unnamed protein product [Penicillium salamii]|uniref:Mediator of RNA polymerase II transcription subunit 14 n=1 Tax=Penicillium salamii TaxID=1612424 RepID=A0A9W4J5D4_9EURO|nr:unnamed protein product [Penicillium salamii]CAG8187203.1 unnamed protein product [Penicillium salamii]CAG8303549.1 unnamed protein product [Penicillium salamii]CAG8365654.1 unnamed protein product [Penicillium salamii]CAG8375767.1 unnamed protein product [Penicillium salamii]
MPGVVMANVNIEGSIRRPGLDGTSNGISNNFENSDKTSHGSGMNGSARMNGALQHIPTAMDKAGDIVPAAPFELPHITQGFFPFGTLINRSVQQCWIELSEVITELAAIDVPPANGKPGGNQSPENLRKKSRLLEFAHNKRAEFIKLLVLSQWSRQAADVSRLIDIQNFIRTRHQAYDSALQFVGEVKRDLVRAQVANPDLKTALEVLSKGRVSSLPDLGYKPPKPLTARATLKKLLKLNRIISVRLTLHDSVPFALHNYRVHDGRVTFTVPGEFELDLSVAEESKTSQFFFVDIRFLFSPSSSIPKGRIFNELDGRINGILREHGLMGCFNFLHGLVLTNKINILLKQAIELARGVWADCLHIELLHRILVVQYWPQRPGPKSWLEIGVRSGNLPGSSTTSKPGVSHLGLRWMRDGQQVSSHAIKFNPKKLSMERILRSVIALHTSQLISAAFNILKKHLLFSNHKLSIKAQISPIEPGDCRLDVQLTNLRSLRVSIEPMSGSIVFCGAPNMLDRLDGDRTVYKSSIEEILSRIAKLRCTTAVNEIETGTKALGLEPMKQNILGLGSRKLFPPGVMRSILFTHRLWNRQWVAAATSSMDGDRWWLVQLRPAGAKKVPRFPILPDDSISLPRAHAVSETLLPPKNRFDFSSYAELVDALTGILAIHANARYLADLPGMHFWPSLKELQLGADLTVPDLLFNYNSSTLPVALRMTLPFNVSKQVSFKEMIRLSFHGIDTQSSSVVIVARGTFNQRIQSLASLVSQMDSELIIEDKGAGFALRLLVPAGHSVVVSVIERLQRLECVIAILYSLIKKGFQPRSLSLSQVAFAYGTDAKYSACFDVGVQGPSLSDHIDVVAAVSTKKPLFQLSLGIKFETSSPHRRIQEALTVDLNNSTTRTGVDQTIELLSITLRLLLAFDQISSLSTESSIVIVTVRKPTEYLINYPRLKSRFQLSIQTHGDKTIWLLRDANGMDQSGRGQIVAATKEKIYQSKGEGWAGLGDGAKASIAKIGNLVLALHECMNTPNLQLDEIEAKPQQAPEQRTQGTSSVPAPQPISMGASDVITID